MKQLLKRVTIILMAVVALSGFAGCDDALPDDLTEYDYKTPKPISEATPDPNKTAAEKIDDFRGALIEKKEGEGLAYSVYSQGIQIDGFAGDAKDILEIPSEIDGVGVIGIASEAFCDNTVIKKVNVPPTVKYIGASAFRRCTNIEEVLLPDGLAFVGDRTFDGCKKLAELIFPDTVSHMGRYVCALSGVGNISIPASLKEIPEGMYYGTSIKEFSVPAAITHIRESAFAKCDGLTEVTVPGNVTYIGSTVFANNINLKKVTIEEGCIELVYGVFEGDIVLEEVHLPKSLVQFNASLFPDANPDFVLYVKENSKAEEFAINKKYEYKIEK